MPKRLMRQHPLYGLIVVSDADLLDGRWRFRDTLVPLGLVTENAATHSIGELIKAFPTLNRADVAMVLAIRQLALAGGDPRLDTTDAVLDAYEAGLIGEGRTAVLLTLDGPEGLRAAIERTGRAQP